MQYSHQLDIPTEYTPIYGDVHPIYFFQNAKNHITIELHNYQEKIGGVSHCADASSV
jgi:hypothetical protein